MYYAQITNGVCTSITETHTSLPQAPDLVALDGYNISLLGLSYEDGEFISPPPPKPDLRVTGVAFKRRLTANERIAIRAAAGSSAHVFDYMDLLNSAPSVHLDEVDVVGGLQMLEAAGVLAAGRAAAILAAPIQEGERP